MPSIQGAPAFGALVRQHRLAAGLTQAALAERAGISERAVQHLERGLGQPQRETLRRLAGVFMLSAEAEAAFEAAARPAPRRPGPRARDRCPSGGLAPFRGADAGVSSGYDGESTPPAPRAHTVLAPLSSFIGREAELAELARWSATARLLTLVGPGGVGKTRLALALAERLADAYADGVVFVDLAPLREYQLVPATIARCLGLREAGGRSARELLLAHLRERHMLLVLDNLEHLLDAALFVMELLQACRRVSVLVTSRTALRVRGEQRFAVLPLATAPAEAAATDPNLIAWPAVRLFVERARAVAPEFVLSQSNAPAVTAICRRLDGLPLAIELAAARVSVLSPEGLLQRLDRHLGSDTRVPGGSQDARVPGDSPDGSLGAPVDANAVSPGGVGTLSVLTGGAPDVPKRQQTLRDTLVWSHDLLAAADQLLFRRLAVFAGGWTLPAAEVACADAALPAHQLLDRLQSLVDHSLIRRLGQTGDEPRFGMLETIREYAVEQLDATAEATRIRERHLTWCLACAESAESELRGPRQQHALAQLEVEHDNMRSALGWSLLRSPLDARDARESEATVRLAGSLARFWSARGFTTEGRAWLERAVASAGATRPGMPARGSAAARAKLLLGLGWLCAAHGDFDLAHEHDEASLALYRAVDDRRGMAAPLLAMAHLAEYHDQSQRAQALLEESIEHARAAGDDNQVGEALCWLARALYRQGDLDAARAGLRESANLLRRTGDLARLAGSLYVQGVIEAEQGNHAAAEATLARSRTLYYQAGDRVGETHAIAWLGYTALHAGDYPAARTYLCECVERGRHDHLNELPRWLCLLARLDRADGRADAAWTHAREALALYQHMDCPAPAVRALEVASGLFAATRVRPNVELAARLFGAAEAKRQGSSGLRLAPAECADHERDVGLVRAQLPRHVAARAWQQGRGMRLEEAIAEALAAAQEPAARPEPV